jgi:hypothetical protein
MTVVLVSKKWFDGLPAHVQAITRGAATQVDNEIRPWAFDFLLEQRKAWVRKGGELIALSRRIKPNLRPGTTRSATTSSNRNLNSSRCGTYLLQPRGAAFELNAQCIVLLLGVIAWRVIVGALCLEPADSNSRSYSVRPGRWAGFCWRPGDR